MRKIIAVVAPLFLIACALSWCLGTRSAQKPLPTTCAPDAAVPGQLLEPPVEAPHRFANIYDGGFFSGNGTTFYTSGTAGTVTVPAGAYVTMISCTAGSSGGTVQITPAGPSITDAQASPPITLNASQSFTVGKPVLTGNPNEMGAGTTIVFTTTTTYVVWMIEYGGP